MSGDSSSFLPVMLPNPPTTNRIADNPSATSTSTSTQHVKQLAQAVRTRLHPDRCVIVVDPISTGANVADVILRSGCACLRVTSGELSVTIAEDEKLRCDFLTSFTFDSTHPDRTVTAIQLLIANGTSMLAVLAGSELGVECADYLSEKLGLPSNGTSLSNARRDKYIMQETIRAAGIRAVKQCQAKKWEEVIGFIRGSSSSESKDDASATMFPCIIKPTRSAGSDNVHFVRNEHELFSAYLSIMNHVNALGVKNESCCVQEFLDGKEYVVDSVSKNGEHKIVAIWEYDKRTHMNAEFVYFGMGCISGSSVIGRALSMYTMSVLDALGIRHGAGHAEVILTNSGPCLVEIGARAHGCEGTFAPLASCIYGYNQVNVLVDSVLNSTAYELIPVHCSNIRAYGFKLDFVCSVSGILTHVAHLDEMKKLPSFLSLDLIPAIGTYMTPTVDCFSACGSVSLVHTSRAQVDEDVRKVRLFEKTMWITKEEEKHLLVTA